VELQAAMKVGNALPLEKNTKLNVKATDSLKHHACNQNAIGATSTIDARIMDLLLVVNHLDPSGDHI